MTPQQITLSYTAEDGTTQSREYTDLSQVWHPASEPPPLFEGVFVQEYDPKLESCYCYCCCFDGDVEEIKNFRTRDYTRWAYLEDLLPPGSWPEFPDD